MSVLSRSRPRPQRAVGPSRRRRPSREQVEAIDYRNADGLLPFLFPRGRIKGRGQTGLSRRDQRRLAREVKRARELALLPYALEVSGRESTRGRRETRY